MLKIFSHPRSGTHFLEAFVAKNFYPNTDLKVENLEWGHWSNRMIKNENPYGKLFGGHGLPKKKIRIRPNPILYIYRDGKAVAYSIWKTPNFLNKEMSKMSFSEFLRTPLDWQGTPGKKTKKGKNIIDHWVDHVQQWHELKGNVVYISYEKLIDNPEEIYRKILLRCFPYQFKKFFTKQEIDVINKPLGLLPNKGTKDGYKEVFSNKDIEYFNSRVPKCLRK
jgi:bile-salt sulfotransferase